MSDQHARRFGGQGDKLRSEQRLALLEVERVVALATDGLAISSVLDVGIGTGVFAEALAKHGYAIGGVDVREDMLEKARAYVPNGDFRLGQMEQLPWADQEFDLLFLGHVLHETEDIEGVLRECKRVARQRIAVLEWPHRVEEIGPPLHHRLTVEAVETAARTIGFAKIETVPLAHMVFFRFDIA